MHRFVCTVQVRLVVCILLTLSACSQVNPYVEDKDLNAQAGEDITIAFVKTGDADAGNGQRTFTATITISNFTPTSISGWELMFPFDGQLSTMVGGTFTQVESWVLTTPTAATSEIGINGSQQFTFSGTYTSSLREPAIYAFNDTLIATPRQEAFFSKVKSFNTDQLADVAQALRDAISGDPEMTVAERTELAYQTVESYGAALTAQQIPGQDLWDATSIEERLIAGQYPWEVPVMLYTRDAAFNQPNEPTGSGQDRFPEGNTQRNNNGSPSFPPARHDAFRHTLLNALMTTQFSVQYAPVRPIDPRVGANRAEEWANAHECQASPFGGIKLWCLNDLHQQNAQNSGDPDGFLRGVALEIEMDLINNAWAREWALAMYPNTFPVPNPSDMAELLYEYITSRDGYSGIVAITECDPNNLPSYVIKHDQVQYAGRSQHWCLIPIEEHPHNHAAFLEVIADGLEDVQGVVRLRSALSTDPAQAYRDHPITAEGDSQVYILVDPDNQTHMATIEATGADGYLVVGLQKPFNLTVGEQKVWAPTATLTPSIKPTYDGPIERCPRLQGTFTVAFTDLFDGPMPDVPLNDNTRGMTYDDFLMPVVEQTKLSNEPLSANVESMRNCSVEAGQHTLGFFVDYVEPTTGTAFYVHMANTFDNLDNRWPGFIWNRSDLTVNPDACPAIPIDIGVTAFGEPDQVQYGIPPGGRMPVLMSSYNQYTVSSQSEDFPNFGTAYYFTPDYDIDSEFVYNGVSEFFHIEVSWYEELCQGPNASGPTRTKQPRAEATGKFELQGDVRGTGKLPIREIGRKRPGETP